MYQNNYGIFKYHPQVNYFQSPLQKCAANAIVGTTGIRSSGSFYAFSGTPTSQSWTSGTKEIIGVEVVYFTIGSSADGTFKVSLQNISSSSGIRLPSLIPLAEWTGSFNAGQTGVVSTHTFTSSYTILPDTPVSVVFEVTSIGSASFTLGPMVVNTIVSSGDAGDGEYYLSLKTNTASAWQGATDALPCLRFKTSDDSTLYYKGGYVGMMKDSSTTSDFLDTTTGTGLDSGDERGMLWVPKKTYDLTGFNVLSRLRAPTTETDFCMYKDTTLLASRSAGTSENVSDAVPAAYGMTFTDPIRVYPGDNIRVTVKPKIAATRWYRVSMISDDDMNIFFGGDQYENNLSLTNRVDEGAWNTPPSASSSFTPVQLYGYEVTGSALLSGSNIISGSVTNQGNPVEGATVRVIRQSDNVVATTSSNASGYYQFNLVSGSYHAIVEYESGSIKYNALSKWNVGAV